MHTDTRIFVVIPALNEAASLPRVLAAIPAWVDAVYVADNGSTDATATVAAEGGAIVVHAVQRGYGSACLRALEAVADAAALPDIIVFIDADFSDYPEQMDRLVAPIVAGDAELVIGSRVMGNRERGALTPQQRFGNALACRLMRWIWKVRHTDLGPFRAIRYEALQRLDMDDPNYGWTVQMQVRAAKRGVRAIDVPVDYRKRIGKSKISGTVRGVVAAGTKILGVIFAEAFRRRASAKASPQKNRPAQADRS